MPDNISLLDLPPYSPEPNPVENIWQYLRQNQFSNRVHDSYATIVDACCIAWNALTAMPDQIHRNPIMGKNGQGIEPLVLGPSQLMCVGTDALLRAELIIIARR